MNLRASLLIVLISLSLLSCNTKATDYNSTIEIVENFSDLELILDKHSDKTIIMNFWATSCPPCIKEMPHFNHLATELNPENTKVLLVSLDRAKDLDSRIYPFVKKHQIKPEVLLLSDDNYSAWTDKVDPSWYGALPATLITKGDNRKFRFGIYETYTELLEDAQSVSQK